MNIPKNKDKTFYADINIFFSTYLPVYIHKVFNFALYQQGAVSYTHLTLPTTSRV